MNETLVRQLRRIKMNIVSAREAIKEIRLSWDVRPGTREAWRQSEIASIATDDAEYHLSNLIHNLDSQDASVRVIESRRTRLGGIRMTFVKASQKGRMDALCPMVYCDGCGTLIEGSGTVLYEVDPNGIHALSNSDLFYFHKGHSREFERDRGGEWRWDELQMLPLRLAANLSCEVKGDRRRYTVTRRKNPADDGFMRASSGAEANAQPAAKKPEAARHSRTDPRRSFSPMQKQEILLRSNGHCVSCASELGLDWHADHIYPHSLGGVTEVINGQALCRTCNQRKRAKVLTVEQS